MEIQSISSSQVSGMSDVSAMRGMGGASSIGGGGSLAEAGQAWSGAQTGSKLKTENLGKPPVMNISDVLGGRVGGSGPSAGTGVGDEILRSFKQGRQKVEEKNPIHPFQLTSDERVNSRPAYEGNVGVSTPATLGDTISTMLEGVHEKTVSYEEKSDAMASQGNASPVDDARQQMTSSYGSLSGKVAEQKSEMSVMNDHIQKYMGVMKDSYEYYIFTTMTIDVGKDVSQTANNLTKG